MDGELSLPRFVTAVISSHVFGGFEVLVNVSAEGIKTWDDLAKYTKKRLIETLKSVSLRSAISLAQAEDFHVHSFPQFTSADLAEHADTAPVIYICGDACRAAMATR